MTKYGWKSLGSQVAYENPFMRVLEYDVVRPNGKRGPYWVLDRICPFSIIIPLTPKNETYLVGQYRFAVDFYSWEFPMGAVVGKESEEMAKQELREETGLTAKKWEKIGSFFVAGGHANQECHVFCAKDLTQGEPDPEPNEFLEVKKAPINIVSRMIEEGKILDSPTITAYHLFKARFKV